MKIYAVNEQFQTNGVQKIRKNNIQNSYAKSLLNEEPKDTVSFKSAKEVIKTAAAGAAIGGTAAGIGVLAASILFPVGLVAGLIYTGASAAGMGLVFGAGAYDAEKNNKK